MKLLLKGERCDSIKCPIEKKKDVPGVAIKRRKNLSEYGLQLREKQKVKRCYCLLEKQFRNYFKKALRIPGATGQNLLILLEKRLDNAVFRLGFASSRAAARQLVRHSNITVNGKKTNIPSYQIKVGDVIALTSSYSENNHCKEALQRVMAIGTRSWLELDCDNKQGKVIAAPSRTDIDIQVNENMIVELYNR